MAVRYLVPDGQHLPVSKEDGKPDHHLMGAAWAALHGGYRGREYEGPDKEGARSRLRALYRSEGMTPPSSGKGYLGGTDGDFRYIFCQAVKFIDGQDGTFYVDGVMVAEEPDLTNEVWDYATSKANIIEWSNRIAAKTGGKSLGNLRSMHGDNTTACGRFLSVTPDDTQRLFHAVAEVVDPIDQEKCRKGVYSGFSIKAPYAKKWPDMVNGRRVTRWTSGVPIETSLVDVPCIPSACFTMKMADGTEVIKRFAGTENSIEEEITDMTVEELQALMTANNKTLVDTVNQLATKMNTLTELVTAKKSAATKCDMKAADCDNPDCATHSTKGKSFKAIIAEVTQSPEHEYDGAIPPTSVATHNGDSTGMKAFLAKKVEDAVKSIDIKAAIAEQFAPIEKAVDTLTITVARLAGTPMPTAAKANGSATVVDKSKDTGDRGSEPAKKSAAELVKEGKAADAIKMIHEAGPSHVLTNRGLTATSVQ